MTEFTADDLKRLGGKWMERIRAAEKREDTWSSDAQHAEEAFSADPGENDLPWFNILHSNVETIVPAIYNSTPKPDYRPRHQNFEPKVLKEVADAYERATATQIDDNRLDGEVEMQAQDAFMAGRGIVRVRFDSDEDRTLIVDEEGNPILDENGMEQESVRLFNHQVIYENVSWRDYREGPAKRWPGVPWVCFRHEVSEIERERLENPELVSLQKIKRDTAEEDKDNTIWEIWDKETKRVIFLVEDTEVVLDVIDDPLGLNGFFPMPAPVQPIMLSGKRTPVCPYSIYKKLAGELDTATKRINAIMKGLKVRGALAGAAEAVQRVAAADDNELVPVADLESLVAMGGLEKAVMWWPIDTAIQVLGQLYIQREQCKQAIYEITGISDIVRGQGAASETATAQQIKTQWGSLRVKKMQRLVERQVRDLFVLTAEIISRHFPLDEIQRASGMKLSPEAAQIITRPLDHYRIDVESDSTVRADLAQNRQEMAEYLQGTSAYFSTMAPFIAEAPEIAGPVIEMYAAFARQFSLGKSGEDALEQMIEMAQQAAGQPKSDPAAELEKEKLGLEKERVALDGQKAQQDFVLKIAAAFMEKAKLEQGERQLNIEEAKAEVDAAAKLVEAENGDNQQERANSAG